MINSDWEGPWVTADHARSMVEFAIPEIGGKIFDAISEYDDYKFYIAKGEGYGRNYEPGDTLGLIAPILIAYGVTDKDMTEVAKRNANFIDGAKEAIGILKTKQPLNVITTSYRQYIDYTAGLAGISQENTQGTYFPIDEYSKLVTEKDKTLVKQWMLVIKDTPKLNINPDTQMDDLSKEQIEAVKKMDYFFFKVLPTTSFGDILKILRPVGGSRKHEAVLKFLGSEKLSDSVTIGDSITDVVMLDETRKAGGLAICFNGNEYAMRNSNFSIISDNCLATAAVVDIFRNGGMQSLKAIAIKWGVDSLRKAAEDKILSEEIFSKLISAFPSKLMKFPIVYDLEDGEDLSSRIMVSKTFRKKVRGKEIGSLG
jgi:energy-converting hydrogenase A subunit R